MKKKIAFSTLLTFVLAAGFLFVSCESPTNPVKKDPKTIVIENVPNEAVTGISSASIALLVLYNPGAYSTGTGTFVAGTNLKWAGVDKVLISTGNWRLTVPLYDRTGNDPWTGTGRYDVSIGILPAENESPVRYWAYNVNITSATTTINYSSFIPEH